MKNGALHHANDTMIVLKTNAYNVMEEERDCVSWQKKGKKMDVSVFGLTARGLSTRRSIEGRFTSIFCQNRSFLKNL